MSEITIYTTRLCPYCVAAKRLLKHKKAAFDEIDVTFSPGKRRAMMAQANGKTSVPQIFIGGRHIGGCEELYALENQGGLDPLLAQE